MKSRSGRSFFACAISTLRRTGYSVIVPGNLVRCLGAEGIFSMPPPGIFRVSRSQRVRMHEYTLAARTYARVRAQGHSAHRGVRGPRITADSSAFKLPPPGIFSMHVYTHAGRHSGVHAQAAPGYAVHWVFLPSSCPPQRRKEEGCSRGRVQRLRGNTPLEPLFFSPGALAHASRTDAR